jgi:WD40 repeat protein
VISVSCPPDREAVSIALPGGAVRVLERSGSLACEHKFQGFVTQLAYKPRSRGNQLAVTCADGQIYVWRPERSTAKPEPFQHCGALVTCMAFTPDGDYLVAGSTCGAVRRWPSV